MILWPNQHASAFVRLQCKPWKHNQRSWIVYFLVTEEVSWYSTGASCKLIPSPTKHQNIASFLHPFKYSAPFGVWMESTSGFYSRLVSLRSGFNFPLIYQNIVLRSSTDRHSHSPEWHYYVNKRVRLQHPLGTHIIHSSGRSTSSWNQVVV